MAVETQHSFDEGKSEAQKAIQTAKNAINRSVAMARGISDLKKKGALNVLINSPRDFFGSLKYVPYLFALAILLFVFLLFIGLSSPLILQQLKVVNGETEYAGINYTETKTIEMLIDETIAETVGKQYDEAVKDALSYMMNEANNKYGCQFHSNDKMTAGEAGYDNSVCRAIMVMGSEDITDVERASYQKNEFIRFIIANMDGVNALLTKAETKAVTEGEPATKEESLQAAQSIMYLQSEEKVRKAEWAARHKDQISQNVRDVFDENGDKTKSEEQSVPDGGSRAEQDNDENSSEPENDTQEEGAAISGKYTLSLIKPVSVGKPYVYRDEEPAESEETEENEQSGDEEDEDFIDFSRIGDDTYIPEIAKENGTETTNLYSIASLEYLQEFLGGDDRKVIWASGKDDWTVDVKENESIEGSVCERYDPSTSTWTNTGAMGCTVTEAGQENTLRKLYKNASYYDWSADGFSVKYLYWNDSLGFDETIFTPEGEPISTSEETMQWWYENNTLGITEDDVVTVNDPSDPTRLVRAIKCYRERTDEETGETTRTMITWNGQDELEEETATYQKKLLTYYIPIYYDLFDYHGEEIDNIIKAVMVVNPDISQEDATKQVHDMIDAFTAENLQMSDLLDMATVIEQKRYEPPKRVSGGIADMLLDGEYQFINGFDTSAPINWHSIMREITDAGQSYFGNQCTDFAKWRFLKYYGWVYMTGGNGQDVARFLVGAYSDKFDLVSSAKQATAGSIFSRIGGPYGHVGFVEEVGDDYIIISEGNYGTGHAIRVNVTIPLDAWESEGPYQYAVPKEEYLKEINKTDDSDDSNGKNKDSSGNQSAGSDDSNRGNKKKGRN